MFLTVLTLCALTTAEIVDYTSENFVLVETGEVALYEDYGTLFHITNLTYIDELVEETRTTLNITTISVPQNISPTKNELNIDITQDLFLIDTYLQQLKISKPRTKRSIDTIGTIWKLIAGTPDHDDMVKVNEKINDIVNNNNRQYAINSKIFQTLTEMTKIVNNMQHTKSKELVTRQRNRLILSELQNIMQTITFAKAGVLNAHILNNKDLKNLIENEKIAFTLSDLIDVSSFKIIQNKDLIILYIKYPKLNQNCTLFEARAISQNDGKLIIDNKIAKCNKKYINVKSCKTEIFQTYCNTNTSPSCLSDSLNNNIALCKKIKEKNIKLEIIRDGAILISGTNKVNESTLTGTYLVTFDSDTTINNVSYSNPSYIIRNYLKNYQPQQFFIMEYIESNNTELKIENISLLSRFQENVKQYSIIFLCSAIAIIIFILYFLLKLVKQSKKRSKRIVPVVVHNNKSSQISKKLKANIKLNDIPFF